MYVNKLAFMSECPSVCVCVCTYVSCMFIHRCARVCVCVCVRVCVCMHGCMCTRVSTCMHMHASVHASVHGSVWGGTLLFILRSQCYIYILHLNLLLNIATFLIQQGSNSLNPVPSNVSDDHGGQEILLQLRPFQPLCL